MSEQQPQPSPGSSQGMTNSQTIIFMVALSLACALILSVLASMLAEPKEIAKDLDRSKQMMIAAKILDHRGYFLIEKDGQYIPAKMLSDGELVEGSDQDIASRKQLLEAYKKRLAPLLVNDKGEVTTFKEAGLNEEKYVSEYKKSGYYKQPLKLIYEILPATVSDKEKPKAVGYVIPVNGYGLWDAIYGYLALKPDGDTVIGITWYDQKETPGLGANISEPSWQNQFPGKVIFQPTASGEVNPLLAPIGIIVVKGKVSDVLGSSPKAKSAVDGMAGATLTGNGVTDAYREVLSAYRPFLSKVYEESEKTGNEKKEQ